MPGHVRSCPDMSDQLVTSPYIHFRMDAVSAALCKEVCLEFTRSHNRILFDKTVTAQPELFPYVTLPDPEPEIVPNTGECIRFSMLMSYVQVLTQKRIQNLVVKKCYMLTVPLNNVLGFVIYLNSIPQSEPTGFTINSHLTTGWLLSTMCNLHHVQCEVKFLGGQSV